MLKQFKKLDPQVKAEWTAELRSDHYYQGREKLKMAATVRDEKGNWDIDEQGQCQYCCLGVLAEQKGILSTPDEENVGVNGLPYLIVIPNEVEDDDGAPSYYDALLPEEFIKEINLDDKAMGLLWRLNDGIRSPVHDVTRLPQEYKNEVFDATEYVEVEDLPSERRWSFEEIADWIDKYL